MSLRSFIAGIIDKISDFFRGLVPELKEAVKVGVTVVDKLKAITDSQAADILTAIIPGTWDDQLKDKLRAELPKILSNMRLVQECADETDPEKIVACAVRTLQQLEGDFKSAFLHNLAILIAQVAADGKLSWSDGVYILQYVHDHRSEVEAA